MPNIPTYDQPALGLTPTEVGIQANTQAAYRGRALYNEAAESIAGAGQKIGRGIAQAGAAADDYVTHQQINAGADHGATLFANLTDSLNQTEKDAIAKDPHDPAIAQKWREEQLEPALEQFQKGFITERSQEWASHFANTMRQHFFEKSSAISSNLASISAQTTIEGLGTKLSNSALTDPSSVPAALSFVDHSIDGIVATFPDLKAEEVARIKLEVGEKIKKQIVDYGGFGVITNSKNPEAAISAWSKQYAQYVDGPKELALAHAAKAQTKSNLASDKAALLYQKQIDTLNVEAARNKVWNNNVVTDNNGNVTLKPDFFKGVMQIPAQYPNAPNATDTARTLLDWGQKQLEKTHIVTDQDTAADLDGRMFAPDNPTSTIDILKAEAAGKLSRQDGEPRLAIVKERDQSPIRDPLFKDSIAAARSQIEITLGTGNKIGTEKFVGFMQAFMGEYLKQSRAGTLPPNALNLNDPDSLISKTIAPYRNPMALAISSNGGVGAPAAPVNTSLPPIADRVKGKVYQLPRGQMKWTGTGWQPAAQ